MRKIAVLGIVLLSVAAFGCSKKPAENSETQMAPAPASQEAAPAAPAAPASQEAAPAAPAQGADSMGNEPHQETPPSGNDGAAK